jgi:CRP/FNR family transcriptional regulator
MQAHATAIPVVTPAVTAPLASFGAEFCGNLATLNPALHKHAGETLFAEGDRADAVYELISGTLRLCKVLADGRRQITGFATAGRVVGFTLAALRTDTAEAITEVTVVRYARQAFDRLVRERPALTQHLLGAAVRELHQAQEQMLLLGRKAAPEKVASFLLAMAEQQGDGDDATEVALPMGRNDIADYLGLTVETVSRTFTKLKRERVIALPTATCVEIRDRDRLEEIAEGGLECDHFSY